MIKSMTGYGRGKYQNGSKEYTVEIKTINHRYNDTSIRLPRYLIFLEDRLRQYISQRVFRGKIEVFVSVDNLGSNDKIIKVDKNLAKTYVQELNELAKENEIESGLTAFNISRLPDVINMRDNEDEELYWNDLKMATDEALKNIIGARETEGERLKQDILNRLDLISNNVEIVSEKSTGLVEEYKQKLLNRIKEINATQIIDENRIGVEVVLFADKSSICEEVTRLKSHITSLKTMLETDNPIGKKLDFLVQEMNREINTIGSKANSLNITNYVVDTKNEIENIREQIQNIE